VPAPPLVATTPVFNAPVPSRSIPWLALAAYGYASGAMGMLLYVLFQHWRLRRFARLAISVHDVEWRTLLDECAVRLRIRRPVRLLRSREQNVPMTFGTRAPSIVIPAVADPWSDERRTAVCCTSSRTWRASTA
jgi:beta-lactamase regulating signal transducer with metallopeptidase domain